MSEAFKILAQFLDRFGSEVEGRAHEPLPAELQAQIKELAQGKLSATGRDRISELLKQHPEWIGELAAAVKARRSSPPG